MQMYRYLQVKGKNEFVWISRYVEDCLDSLWAWLNTRERFDSREAYDAHLNSAHVHAWLKKYPDNPQESELYSSDWVFREMGDSEDAGGSDRK
jgi:hypothetical protein